MFLRIGNSETSIEELHSKRTLQEQYIQREKESIEASRKTILLEKERLQGECYDLSPHLYQEIEQDLRELTLDLQERESAFEVRKQHYEERWCELQSQEGLWVEEVNAKRPFWKRWMGSARESIGEFLIDGFEGHHLGVEISMVVMLVVATFATVMKILI